MTLSAVEAHAGLTPWPGGGARAACLALGPQLRPWHFVTVGADLFAEVISWPRSRWIPPPSEALPRVERGSSALGARGWLTFHW